MTRSLVAFTRWSLTPGTLLLETIRASDCGPQDEWSPKPEVAQDRFYCLADISKKKRSQFFAIFCNTDVKG